MNTIRFTSKQAFVAALEGRRKFWQDFDQRQEREHKAAERKWLAESRATLREALKWDYETFQSHYRKHYGLKLSDVPTCPALMEAKIDAVLAALKHTQGQAFTVATQGAWSEAHNLLTWDPDARRTVC